MKPAFFCNRPASPLADWLVEHGIGEHRAVRVVDGRIVAARMDWLTGLVAGQVDDAVLTDRVAEASRGTVRFPNGEQALVDRLPKDASEGAALRVAVTRPAIAERGRFKLAQCRPIVTPPKPPPITR